jgi:hypothetical protein
MIEDALTFPAEGEEGITRVALGGAVLFLSFLVVPVFWVMGYGARCGLAGVREDATPPSFTDDVGGQVVDGLRVVGVSVAYSLVPMLVFAAGMVFGAAGLAQGGGVAAGAGVFATLLALAGALGSLVAGYVFPAAVMRMMEEGRFGAAFEVRTVVDAAATTEYLTGWALAVGVAIVLGVVNQILGFTVVGLVLVPFTAFYQQVVTFYLYGRGYGAAVGASGSSPGEETPGAGAGHGLDGGR